MEGLTIGIGNGNLLKPVAECLGQFGVAVDTETRRAWQEINHELVGRVFISRPQHVVTYLEQGKIDCALIGQDMLAEYGGYGIERQAMDWRIFFSFPFSKSSWDNCARVVVFLRSSTVPSPRFVNCLQTPFSVLSEYPRLTHWFAENNRKTGKTLFALTIRNEGVVITPSTGSTEGPVSDGVYEFGVGITDSGRTLTTNNVHVIATIMEAPVVLVGAGPILVEHRDLDRKIIELGELFGDALTEKRRGK